MRFRVASSNFESCTFALLATSDSGTPRASTNRLLLRPFFSPIRRVRPHAFGCQRSFARGPVDTLPIPCDAAGASRQLFLDTAREVRNVREAWRVAADDPATLGMIPLDLQTRQEQLMNTVQTSNTVAIRPSTNDDNAAPAWIA